jgi:transposase
VIDGILHRVRTGVQWRDLPERFGPWKTIYDRHRLWSADGTWERVLLSLLVTPGQRADTTQFEPVLEKIRVPRTGPGRPRKRPESVTADKAYSNGPCRRYLRRRGIPHVIPEKSDTRAARLRKGSRGGRPPGFDSERYKKRNTVERAINKLKQSRAVATRYDKRGYVFLGTVTAASVVIRLRSSAGPGLISGDPPVGDLQIGLNLSLRASRRVVCGGCCGGTCRYAAGQLGGRGL